MLVPSTFVLVLVAFGLLVALRWRRSGLGIAAAGSVLALLAAFSPAATLLLRPLEDRFPAFHGDGRPVDGVIMLGGGEETLISAYREQPAFSGAGERIMALSLLARTYPQARLVFSGGSARLAMPPPGEREADVVKRTLPWLGIPVDRVALEGRSRNTRENALFTKDLMQPKPGERWLLVTSAVHMPRAVGCFRAAGFPVEAFPVDYQTGGPGAPWTGPRTAAEGLQTFDTALREWVGLAVYYFTGRIPNLFPAP
nr:YdcF family protein [Ancylobacter crimeensis]